MRFTVGTQPQGIFPDGLGDSFALTNDGPWTVYLDNDTSVSDLSMPLPPTATIVWDAQRPLFVKAAGEGTSLIATRNKNVSNAGRNAIWQMIARDTNVAIGSLVIKSLGTHECGAYQSLLLHLETDKQGLTGENDDYFDLWVTWYSADGTLLHSDQYQINRPRKGIAQVTLPVEGDRVLFQIRWNIAETSTLTLVRLYGTSQIYPKIVDWIHGTLSNNISLVRGAYWDGADDQLNTDEFIAFLTWNSVVPSGGGGAVAYPPIYLNNIGKRVKVTIRHTGAITAAGFALLRCIQSSAVILHRIDVPVVGASGVIEEEITVPVSAALCLTMPSAPTTGGSVHVTLSWREID